MVPKTFKVDLPDELAREALKCKTDEEARAWEPNGVFTSVVN